MLIYLRRGITEKEVEEFRSAVLADAGNKYDLPAFVRLYWRLSPDQANGQRGIALYFFDQARPAEMTSYVEKIKHDSRVDAVYPNISADTIQRQLNHSATRVSSRQLL